MDGFSLVSVDDAVKAIDSDESSQFMVHNNIWEIWSETGFEINNIKQRQEDVQKILEKKITKDFLRNGELLSKRRIVSTQSYVGYPLVDFAIKPDSMEKISSIDSVIDTSVKLFERILTDCQSKQGKLKMFYTDTEVPKTNLLLRYNAIVSATSTPIASSSSDLDKIFGMVVRLLLFKQSVSQMNTASREVAKSIDTVLKGQQDQINTYNDKIKKLEKMISVKYSSLSTSVKENKGELTAMRDTVKDLDLATIGFIEPGIDVLSSGHNSDDLVKINELEESLKKANRVINRLTDTIAKNEKILKIYQRTTKYYGTLTEKTFTDAGISATIATKISDIIIDGLNTFPKT